MRISIVTSVFNGMPYLAAAMDSVAGQQGVEIEHVVADGGSRDGSLEYLQTAVSSVARILEGPDRGVYDALNKGFAQSSGDILGLLHADDLFARGDVLSQVEQVFQDPSVDMVYGDLLYVQRDHPDRTVRLWRSGPFSRRRLKYGWMPPHPTVFLRRRLWDQLGPYRLDLDISADYEWLLRALTLQDLKVRYLPEVLVKMRVGGISNRSMGNLVRKSRQDLWAMRAHGVGGVASLAAKNLRKLPQFIFRT